MSSSSPFDAGNMAATPPQTQKRSAWCDDDDVPVTVIDFSKRPKYEKSTHVDSFPAEKNKFVTTVKWIELENWKTGQKIGLKGLLFNTCIKHDGKLIDELQKICEVSK